MDFKSYKNIIIRIIASVILGITVFIVSINTYIPSRDSGVFLYSGKQILNGGIPYRDFWDHKPPIIFYINALAVKIFDGSLWGLWLLETISITITLYTFLHFTHKKFNLRSSIFGGIFLFILTTKLLEGGNRVEEFGLLFQSITLLIISSYFSASEKTKIRLHYILGFLGGMLFLLKPNLIGIIMAFSLIILFEKSSYLWKKKVFWGLGMSFLTVISLVFFYFSKNNSLGELIDQVFVFNSYYSYSGLKNKFEILRYFIDYTKSFSYIIFTIPVYIILNFREKIGKFRCFAILWIIIELMLCLVSHREYKQYFLTVILSLSTLASMSFYDAENKYFVKNKNAFFVLVLLFLMVFNYKTFTNLIINIDQKKPISKDLKFRSYLYNNFLEHEETIEFIKTNTKASDKILIWGSEPAILYISDRDSADRYLYQFRLFLPGYDKGKTKLKEHILNIIKEKPKIIIDASSSSSDSDISECIQSPPLNIQEYELWLKKSGNLKSEHIMELIKFIENNYTPSRKTYEGRWNTYVWNN